MADRFSSKQVLLVGLAANITAMVLLVITSGIKSDPAAYPLLLTATAFLGAGFGLTVPVLNTYVAAFRLSSLYGWTAVAAAAMALLSFAVAARQASPRELHPRPAGHEQQQIRQARHRNVEQ